MNRYEKAFFEAKGDAYCIYQLKEGAERYAKLLFTGMAELKEMGLKPEYRNYEAVHAGTFAYAIKGAQTLEDLYVEYNAQLPPDFKGHSLSVSDIIMLRQGDTMTAHFVNNIGFAPAPDFALEMTEAANREKRHEERH